MQRLQRGFGLVEIMVGLVVSMVSMLVVLQVFQNAEARKRTTTAGADAQSNGAIALYMIERDARMSGWGMEPGMFSDCQTVFSYCDGSAECGGEEGPIAGMNFQPLLLTDGGSGPDTITVQYFADPDMGSFRIPSSATLRRSMPQSSSELDVNTVSGCREGDLMLARQAGNCTLMNITHVQEQASKLQHNPGKDGIYNPPAGYQKKNGWPAYTRGARLSCFKRAATAPIFRRSFSVNAQYRQLERGLDNAGSELVMADIVDLQAQYGIAPPNSQNIDQWVNATAAPWLAPGPDDWRRIKAVRVALVARSNQPERPAAGKTECATTTLAATEKWSGWAKFDTKGYPADWSCYRYKVFETVIPLRNVIWGNL